MNQEFAEVEPKESSNNRKIGLGALIVGILLVVGVAASSNTAKSEGQLKRQTAIEHSMYAGLPASSVQDADYSVPLADLPKSFFKIRADVFAQGWQEILVCGDSLGGNFHWNEFNGGLAKLKADAQTHLYFVRLYKPNGDYVQSKNILSSNSVYMNLRSNNHINELTGKLTAAQVGTYLDANWIYSPAAMKNHMTFGAPNASPKSFVGNGFVYWANGNSKGLHVQKTDKWCIWDWGNRNKRGNAEEVFMFVKKAVCV